MTFPQKADYIKYRINNAFKTFESAKYLAQEDYFSDCVSRLYYSCFYAISALLLKNDINTKSHKGLKSAFNQEFIKSEVISKQSGITFNKVHDMRIKGDYNDFFDFNKDNVLTLFEPVEQLLLEINELLNK
ncbi:MAG: HEPN domain-containing protein [Bacteroidales bacterium]|nr:HEPN domain-containing protein [Bacteroidales bacterium]